MEIKPNQKWTTKKGLNKVIDILEKEKFSIVKNSEKSNFTENNTLKQESIGHLTKKDTKTGLEQLIDQSARKPLDKSTQGGVNNSNIKDDVQANKIFSNELQSIIAEKQILQSTKISQVKQTYSFPEPLPKIFNHMVWMARAGEQKSRIRINPPELGRLDLNLTVKNGHLQAIVSAESLVVKELIETNLNQLRQQLTDQGFTVDKFEVMVGLDDKGQKENSMWADRRDGRPSSSRKKNIPHETDEIEGLVSQKSANKLNQVDVLV